MAPQADIDFENELWQTAVTPHGIVSPAGYKHHVLPLLFLRYISLCYEQRYEQLELLLKEVSSPYFIGDPEIDVKIDNAMRLLEETYPDQFAGKLPPIYAASNLTVDQVAGLINLFAKDVFARKFACTRRTLVCISP